MNNDKKLYKDYFNNIKPSQKLVAETKKLMRAEEQKKSHKQRSIFTNPVFMGRFRQYGSFAVSLVFALSATLNVADIKPSLPTAPPEITTEETVTTIPTTETTEYSEPAITASPEKNEPQVTTCDTYKDTDITEKQTDNNITTTGVSKTDTSKVTVKTDENFVITNENPDTNIPETTETNPTSRDTSITTTATKTTTDFPTETTIINKPDTTTSSSKFTTTTTNTTESSNNETKTIVTTTTPKFTTTTPCFTTATPEIITVTPSTTAPTIDTSENNVTTSTTNHSDSEPETVTTPTRFTTTTPYFTTTPRITTTTPYFPTMPVTTTTPASSEETTCISETTAQESAETTRADSGSPAETTIYNSDFHSYNINCATGLQYLKYESLDTTKIYTYDELTEIFGGSFLPDEFLIDNIQYDYSVTFADKTVSADDSSGLIYFYGDYDETFLSPFLAVRINTDTKFNFMNIFTFEPKTRYYSGAYGIIRQLQIYKVSDNIFSDDPSILVAEFNIFRNGRKVNFQITASQVSTAQFIATLEKFFERLEYL